MLGIFPSLLFLRYPLSYVADIASIVNDCPPTYTLLLHQSLLLPIPASLLVKIKWLFITSQLALFESKFYCENPRLLFVNNVSNFHFHACLNPPCFNWIKSPLRAASQEHQAHHQSTLDLAHQIVQVWQGLRCPDLLKWNGYWSKDHVHTVSRWLSGLDEATDVFEMWIK